MSLTRQRSLSDARREHPWSIWTIVVVVVVLNGWYDYYHPLGILFGVIIVIIWAARSDRMSRNEQRIKGLYSSDIADIEKYQPEEEDNFGFVLRALVGPIGQPGEESFDITVCTPKWLAERYGPSEIILGLHKLIVLRYHYSGLRRFIERYRHALFRRHLG